MIRFVNPIPFVDDIRTSTAFYRDVVGLTVAESHADFVRFEGGFAIHDGRSLGERLWGRAKGSGSYGRGNLLLYFESDDIEATFRSVRPKVELIHPLDRQHWGQRVFRFTDPDGHAVEIGERVDRTGPAQS